jgi:uncharacterized membrane protein
MKMEPNAAPGALATGDPSGWGSWQWLRQPAGWGVWLLAGFTVVALFGYGIFGMHPHRIPPSMIGFWQISYSFFGRFHIVVGGVAIALALFPWTGARWIPSLVAVFILSLGFEYVGTGYGIPFGYYEYTSLLGSRFGGRVPYVIPLSWFLMALPAWVIARGTFPGGTQWAPRILFAAFLLTIWDLPLDPAMAFQAPLYWTWQTTGPYYGMPLINLAGWMLTGVVLMGAMELLGIRRWGAPIPGRWALAYWGITILMPFGMVLLEGLWLAVFVTLAASAVAVAIHRWLGPVPVPVPVPAPANPSAAPLASEGA